MGRDLVGTVAARGPGAPFDVGEWVWANSLRHDGRQGSFSARLRRRRRRQCRSATIAIARRAGARVLASARPADHDRCREAGAEDVVDYRDPDLARRLRGAVPDGVDLFWEISGHHDLDLVAGAVAPRGRVILSAATGELPVLPVRDLYTRALSSLVASMVLMSRAASASSQTVARLMTKPWRLTSRGSPRCSRSTPPPRSTPASRPAR